MKRIEITKCFAVVVEFNAKNISFQDIYDMFKLSGIEIYLYDDDLKEIVSFKNI